MLHFFRRFKTEFFKTSVAEFSSNGSASAFSWFEEVGKANKATGVLIVAGSMLYGLVRADISAFKTDLREEMTASEARMKADMNSMKADLKGDINASEARVKADLKGDMNTMKADLKEDINASEARVKADLKASEDRIMAKIEDVFSKK